ncbi:MAG: LbtU family siderophore porin [Thermodesulfobacteriota bacterium]
MGRIAGVAALLVAAVASTGWAAEPGGLEKQVAELVRQNRLLLERVTELEKRLADREAEERAAENHEKETVGGQGAVEEQQNVAPATETLEMAADSSWADGLRERIEIGVLVEVEAASVRSFDNEETSDVSLATVEAGLAARITPWADAHFVFLYEDGEEDDHVLLDEGALALSGPALLPASLTMGKMYLPFGSFETNLVSDPLTLDIAEINESGLLAALQGGGFYGALFAFNGDIETTDTNDEIRGYGINAGYLYECDRLAVHAGLGWLNNLADSDGLGDYLTDADGAGLDFIADEVPGLAANLKVVVSPFFLLAEYVTALDDFRPGEIDFAGHSARPAAWSGEVGASWRLWQRETVFALGVQGTKEAVALGLPEERYLAAIRLYFCDNTSLALEYIHAEDYAEDEGGSNGSAGAATMQLAVEF